MRLKVNLSICPLVLVGTPALTANIAVPVPFFPNASASRVRMEFTYYAGSSERSTYRNGPTFLRLLINGTAISPLAVSADLPYAELTYQKERSVHEVPVFG